MYKQKEANGVASGTVRQEDSSQGEEGPNGL